MGKTKGKKKQCTDDEGKQNMRKRRNNKPSVHEEDWAEERE